MNPFNDMLLVMDNLSVHMSNEVRERMDELGFCYAYTPAYSPRYNGIEEVINIGKQQVKQMRLDRVQLNQPIDLRAIISEAFTTIDTQQVAKCITRSLNLLALNQ